ncbi:DoxX family protein [Lentiprolixibacter aurantiacus]|uniref:DoxX family protein n=1 Tax=Lentiprolixibacter aurantiacus TaxID=2993939 RepID=A0AAE3MJY0_9FLAO|nr:DoxX family protein [Lentiprolixibacter aurantiacus]MCX2718798.1 DoxX family protein [Lentiprolixibacter aurantiacus]
MILAYLSIAFKVIIFISIINVWFFRFNKATPYRGGGAKSMKEEFEVYGFSPGLMYLIGAIKILLASVLLVSIWHNGLSTPAAGGMGIFMLGAIFMHFRANDPNIRSFPALLFFLLSIGIIVLDIFQQEGF